METAIVVIFIVFFLILTLPTTFLFVYIIKKSTEKKNPAFLGVEKMEMLAKVAELKGGLTPWSRLNITDVSNNIANSFSKWTSRKATGRVFSLDGTALVAFRRIERGLYAEGSIAASTSDFDIYYLYNRNENIIYYNGQLLGRIDTSKTIYDTDNNIIGRTNRISNSGFGYYTIYLNDKAIAEVTHAQDMRTLRRNPFYNSNRKIRPGNQVYYNTGPKPLYKLVTVNGYVTDDELKWINAIGIFESVFYTLDFL